MLSVLPYYSLFTTEFTYSDLRIRIWIEIKVIMSKHELGTQTAVPDVHLGRYMRAVSYSADPKLA